MPAGTQNWEDARCGRTQPVCRFRCVSLDLLRATTYGTHGLCQKCFRPNPGTSNLSYELQVLKSGNCCDGIVA